MNVNRTRKVFYLSAMCIVFLNCRPPLVPVDQKMPFESIRCWGGDNQRSGTSQESISFRLDLCWTYKTTSMIGNSIIAADHFLFFGTKDGRITVLDIRTGKLVRSFGTRKRIEATCLLDPDHLIIVQRTPGPTLKCIDPITMKTRWKRDADVVDGEPLLVRDTLVVATLPGQVLAVDVQTGETIWEKRVGGKVYSSPAQHGDALILTVDNGTAWSLDIRNGDTNWHTRLDASIAATPVLDETKIYIGTSKGQFYALSQLDGSVLWQQETTGGIFEAASVSQNRVFFGTSQGIFYCLDSESGTNLWQYDTESVIGTSPLVTKEHVLFGTLDRTLFMADRTTGEIVWRYEARGRIRTTPLIWQGMLVFASEDRYVYGFCEKK